MELNRRIKMKLDSVDFDYEQGADSGTGSLTVSNEYDYCYFYFEFSAIQEHDCSYSCHSFSQELPDEDYFEYDVIDKITNLDTLVHKIEAVFEVTDMKDKVDNYIRDEFYKKMSKERYLYTREG